jgi:RimJ/RimL family protein N-acetyltransferase
LSGNNIINTPTLETERLILRKFTEDDFPALFDIYSDEEVNTYLPWFPLKSIEEIKVFFAERYAVDYAKPEGYRYAICLKSDNVPIGYINVCIDDDHDLGFGLRKEFWHQGIVSEAVKVVVEQVNKDGMPYITATHDVNNTRSGNVMKTLGMSYKYSYEELWQPKNFLVTFRMYQLNFNEKDEFVYRKYWDMYNNHFVEKL